MLSTSRRHGTCRPSNLGTCRLEAVHQPRIISDWFFTNPPAINPLAPRVHPDGLQPSTPRPEGLDPLLNPNQPLKAETRKPQHLYESDGILEGRCHTKPCIMLFLTTPLRGITFTYRVLEPAWPNPKYRVPSENFRHRSSASSECMRP